MSVVLRYVGYRNRRGEGDHLPGVPARDLTADDLKERKLEAGPLVASGLYEKVAAPARAKKAEPEVEDSLD